ncbi:MAG: hypothetical protein JWM99_4376, partial [Verrucomicrobiales bacterium]|nr:hypothetical protein [Verrucomicrobiales bacterium]
MKPLVSILDFFTSLRLTVVCLTMSMILVFAGTIAQVRLGLFLAQEDYFQSLFVYWHPQGASWQIPIWPGGYLLGGLLLINLVAAQVRRFHFTRKKIGIYITHAGLILLFLGQFTTQLLQVESFMAIPEGGSRSYSESGRLSELAVIDTTDANTDHVIAIPEHLLAQKGEIRHPELPFTIQVTQYAKNSNPTRVEKGGKPVIEFTPAPEVVKMDDRNLPVATIEIKPPSGPVKQLQVATWLADPAQRASIKRQIGDGAADLDTINDITIGGRSYHLVMRPTRYYKPFTMQLIHFSHDLYKGTETPKNFSSRIHLTRPDTAENR